MVTDILQLVQNVLTLAGYVALLVAFHGIRAILALVVAALPATMALEMKFSNTAFRIRNWRSADSRTCRLRGVRARYRHARQRGEGVGSGPHADDDAEEQAATSRTRSFRFGARPGRTVCRSWRWPVAHGCYLHRGGRGDRNDDVGHDDPLRGGVPPGTAGVSVVPRRGRRTEHNLYMSNLFEYFAIPIVQRQRDPSPAVSGERGLRFENVGFQYPGQKDWALRGVAAQSQGQSLALVRTDGTR